MEELENKKRILMAIREAIANMKLESDFNDIEINDEIIENINNKVFKLGGNWWNGKIMFMKMEY